MNRILPLVAVGVLGGLVAATVVLLAVPVLAVLIGTGERPR